jgi:hypothetical protein
MTIAGGMPTDEEPEPAPEEPEQLAAEEAEPAAEPVAEPAAEPAAEPVAAATDGAEPRRRWFRRRRHVPAQPEPAQLAPSTAPSNVRILSPEERDDRASETEAEAAVADDAALDRAAETEAEAAVADDAALDRAAETEAEAAVADEVAFQPDESTDEDTVGPLRRFRRR